MSITSIVKGSIGYSLGVDYSCQGRHTDTHRHGLPRVLGLPRASSGISYPVMTHIHTDAG